MKMRRSFAALAVLPLAMSLSALALADGEHDHGSMQKASASTEKKADAVKEISVVGEVVDMGCYMSHPATGKGASHKECAQMCIKGGMPVGLLTDDGTLYLLLPPHDDQSAFAKAKELVAERVNIKGTVMANGGVNAITVKTTEAAPKG